MNNRVAFLFCFLPISRSEHTALYQRSLGKSNTRTAFPFLGRCSAVVMDVVQGWVTLMREKDGAQALSFFVSEL